MNHKKGTTSEPMGRVLGLEEGFSRSARGLFLGCLGF